MKRFFGVVGSALALLLIAAVVFFFWASSGQLPDKALEQTKSYATEPDTSFQDTLTVTTYNIGYLSGMTNNEPVVRSDSFLSDNMDQATALLRETVSDVVAFQEIDYGSGRSGYVHQLDTLGMRLGYPEAVQAVNWDKRYIPFPYGRPAVNFGRTLSGQSILSELPIRQHERIVLPRPPLWFGRNAFYLSHLAQISVVDVGGKPLAVMNLHLEAFDTTAREEQARRVNEIYDRIVAAGLPVVLLGDLNSVAPASLSALPPRLRQSFAEDETMEILFDETSLRPAFPDSTYKGPDPPATFPADAPNHKIDHIYYPPDLMQLVDRRIRCGAPSPPSDHCAVTASFRLAPRTEWPSLKSLPDLSLE